MIEARDSHPCGISYFETIGSISVANHNCFFLTSVSDEVSITGEGRGESRVMKRGGTGMVVKGRSQFCMCRI